MKTVMGMLLLAMVLIPLPISALAIDNQTPTKPLRSPKALAILEAAANGITDKTTRKALHAAVIHGTFGPQANAQQQNETFTALLVGKHFLITTEANGHKHRHLVLGKAGKAEHNGKAEDLRPSKVSDITSDIFPPFDNWLDFELPSVSIEMMPDETFDNIACYHVVVGIPSTAYAGLRGTFDIDVFLSKQNGLLHAVRYGLNQTKYYNPNIKMVVTYSDYEKLDGLQLPTTIKRYRAGQLITEMHIQSVDSHQSLSDSDLTF